MPAVATSHRLLHLVRNAIQASASQEVIVPLFIDSRSAWPSGNIRTRIGEIYRTWNVQHACIINPGSEANNGERDGYRSFLVGGLTGITHASVAPGGTCPNSGLVNRLPVTVLSTWTTATPANPHFSRYTDAIVTAGNLMDSTISSASTGGNFFRGDPGQSRQVQSVTQYVVTDTRAALWAATRTQWGFNSSANPGLATIVFGAPPAASSGLKITANAAVIANSGGTGLAYWHRHTENPTVGTGIIQCGTKVRWGSTGITVATMSTGGHSTTDALRETNPSRATNTDWKYTDQGAIEYMSVALEMAGKIVVPIIDGGQNQSDIADYVEWNGITIGRYKDNKRLEAQRIIENCISAGAAQVVPLLVSPWQSQTASDRNRLMEQALLELSIEQNWPYYDQNSELVARGYSTLANGLATIYTVHNDDAGGDYVHTGWRGMTEAVGPTMWDVINTAVAPSSGSRGRLGIGLGISI